VQNRLLYATLACGLLTGCWVKAEHVADPASAFEAARKEASRAAGQEGKARHLNVLAYEPDAGEITRVRLPLWAAGRTAIGAEDLEDEGLVGLRFEDLRRAAPGFSLESEEDDGEHVFVWLD
jgi:hypothetical protein